MPAAIVLGATGILGREIVRALSSNPDYPTIHALSRTKKDRYPSHVTHHPIDLLSSPSDMATSLPKITTPTHIFFAAYLQKPSPDDETSTNGTMLSNFLTALTTAQITPHIQRILLVTGAKQYGVHLGQAKNPMLETDPWLTTPPYPLNFYYRQQEILHKFCAENNHVSWTVTYPNDVIGFAVGNFMNLATTIGIYAAITKELGRDLAFPGSERFYMGFDCFTDAKLHAEFCMWAVGEEKTKNQAFNVVNGDVESWQSLWPRVARRFGMKVKEDQFEGTTGYEGRTELEEPVPVRTVEGEMGVKGRVGGSVLEQRVNLEGWSQSEEVKKAWGRLVEREGLERDGLEKATWAFANFVLGRNYDVVISMGKAREAGWNGYRDTWKAFSDVFGELEAANVLPKVH